MKEILTLVIVSLFSGLTFAQNFSPYKIYNSKGKEISFKKLIKGSENADILMFGEEHNSAIAHWLQLETLKALSKDKELVLGAEMIEADNQDELDQYLKGEIDFEGLDTTARLWPNYETDYAPLVDFAKDNNLKFVASNIPRRYAAMVHKGGFGALDTLSAEEKSWIAPLPIEFDPEIDSYQAILELLGDHATPELVQAQAMKDATMAHFIYENAEEGKLFVHFNGSWHSDYHEGIVWYLNLFEPELNVVVITTVTQEDVNELSDEHQSKADFYIVVDEDMTTTY